MAGFVPQTLNNRALTGNQVVVYIGDQPIAFAQTVTHSFEFGSQSYYGIGSALPQEIQQLRIQPQITITAFALTQTGINAAGQSGTIASFLANNSFHFTIVDKSGVHLFTYVGGVASTFNENVPTNQTITDSLTFLCLDVYDETGQSILNVGNALGSTSFNGVPQTGGSGLGANINIGAGGISGSVGGNVGLQFGGVSLGIGGGTSF